jgi:putative salt-induced outer membrane protein YdiY
MAATPTTAEFGATDRDYLNPAFAQLAERYVGFAV